MMAEGMPHVPHATGLITMAQTIVNKISISGKVCRFFLIALHRVGLTAALCQAAVADCCFVHTHPI